MGRDKRDVAELKRARDVDGLLRCLNSPGHLPRAAQAAEALADLGEPRAVTPLLKALQYGFDLDNRKVREYADAALVKIGQPAVQPLAEFIEANRKKPMCCAGAACVAGQIATPDAVEALVKLLAHPDYRVRVAAVLSLGEAEDPDAVPHILTFPQDDSTHPKVRMAVAMALGRLRDNGSVDRLVELAKDTDPEVRRRAVEAMAGWHDSTFTEHLVESLSDPGQHVRMEAEYALMLLGERAVPVLSDVLRRGRPVPPARAAALLRRIGGAEAVRALLETAAERTERHGRVVRRVLVGMGDAAVEPLATLLEDAPSALGVVAVEVLRDIGTDHARKVLSEAVQSGPDSVRRAAADTINQTEGRTRRDLPGWTEVQLPLERGLTPLAIQFPKKCIFCGEPKEVERKYRPVRTKIDLQVPYCRRHRQTARLAELVVYALFFVASMPIVVFMLFSLFEVGFPFAVKVFVPAVLILLLFVWGAKRLLSRVWKPVAAVPFGAIFGEGKLGLGCEIRGVFLVMKFSNAQIARECEQLSARAWKEAPQRVHASSIGVE